MAGVEAEAHVAAATPEAARQEFLQLDMNKIPNMNKIPTQKAPWGKVDTPTVKRDHDARELLSKVTKTMQESLGDKEISIPLCKSSDAEPDFDILVVSSDNIATMPRKCYRAEFSKKGVPLSVLRQTLAEQIQAPIHRIELTYEGYKLNYDLTLEEQPKVVLPIRRRPQELTVMLHFHGLPVAVRSVLEARLVHQSKEPLQALVDKYSNGQNNDLKNIQVSPAPQPVPDIRTTCYPHAPLEIKEDIANLLHTTGLSGVKVDTVLLNMNELLWQRYTNKKTSLKQSGDNIVPYRSRTERMFADVRGVLDGTVNECLLFHGTDMTAAKIIQEQGFEKDFAGMAHGAFFGNGVYFSGSSLKSHGYTRPAEPSGLRTMLLSRVICGNLLEVSGKDLGDVLPQGYHSALGQGRSAEEIVVFDNDQIFPTYIILYR
jgi:hypothetical protein